MSVETQTAPGAVDLSKYDFMVLVDKSGSMSVVDQGHTSTRFELAQEETEALARECSKHDSDGIDIIPFNSVAKLEEGVTPDRVSKVFQENSPGGSTNTAAALQLAIDKHFRTGKPTVIAVITDGQPDDKAAVKRVIIEATKKMNSDDELGITFLQIGDDPQARSFLQELDDELEQQGAKFDIVDTKNTEERAGMSLVDILVQSLTD